MFRHSKKHRNLSMGMSTLETLEPRLLLTTIQYAPVPGVTDPDNPGPPVTVDYYNPSTSDTLKALAWEQSTNHVVEFYYQPTKGDYICVRLWQDQAPAPGEAMPIIEIMRSDPDVVKNGGPDFLKDISGVIWNDPKGGNPAVLTEGNLQNVAGGLPSTTVALNSRLALSDQLDVNALAYDDANGIWYGYSDTSHKLFTTNVPMDGTFSTVVATVQNAAGFGFAAGDLTAQIDGMCFVDATSSLQDYNGQSLAGKILAVGTMVSQKTGVTAPTGQFMLVIDSATGDAYPVLGNYTATTGAKPFNDIDTDGTSIYAVDGTSAYAIKVGPGITLTGQLVPFPGVPAKNMTDGTALTGLTGIAYDGVSKWYISDATQVYVGTSPTFAMGTPMGGKFNSIGNGNPTDLAGGYVMINGQKTAHVYGTFSGAAGTELFEIDTNPPAKAEIYMIYVKNADIHTHIVFDTCKITITVDSQTGETKITDERANAKLYSGSVPLTADIGAPSGSGGILVGADLASNSVASTQTGDATTKSGKPMIGNAVGTFPGGVPVHAGIMVAGQQDFGQFFLPGTLAGRSDFTGSIQDLSVGFLWGQVNVANDLGQLSVKTDFGWDDKDTSPPPIPSTLLVSVGGSVRSVDVQGGFYGNLRVGGNANTPTAGSGLENIQRDIIPELEYHNDTVRSEDVITNDFLAANPSFPSDPTARHNEINNDTPDTAQWVSSETGSFTVAGTIQGDFLYGDDVDWYAVTVMPGEHLVLSTDMNISVFDEDMRMQADRVQTWSETAKTQVYYVAVWNGTMSGAGTGAVPSVTGATYGTYTLTVSGAHPEQVGALRVHKNAHVFGGRGGEAANGNDITLNHGDFGAIRTGVMFNYDVVVYDGILVAALPTSFGVDPSTSPPTVGLGSLTVAGGIGEVHTPGDWSAPLIVGDATHNNASIQTIRVGTLNQPVSATGGIGDIIVLGNLLFDNMGMLTPVQITINSDNVGPYAYCDQIDVRGDYFGLLFRGDDADYRFLVVDGSIYVGQNEYTYGKTLPTGGTATITDDAGGVMTITPGFQLDPATGTLVSHIDPVTGKVVPQTYSTVTYWAVPTYRLDGSEGLGQVVARIDTDGPLTLQLAQSGQTGSSAVEIGKLNMTGFGDVTISGRGRADIAYASGTGIRSFVNTAGGDLVAGKFSFVNVPTGTTGGTGGTTTVPAGSQKFSGINWAGNLGTITGHYAQLVWGRDAVPAGGMMGLVNGMINGITLGATGADSILVNGHIGDIYGPTGVVNTLKAGNDKIQQDTVEMDGIIGVIQALTFNQINVGDGLKASGAAWRMASGIFAESNIGTVTVDGWQKKIAGVISAILDTTVLKNNQNTLVPAIAQIIGKNGAMLTGSVWACDFHGLPSFTFTGGVGNIDFTGTHSLIDGADIEGQYINRVTTSKETDGISNSTLYTLGANPLTQLGIGLVSAGGHGLIGDFFHSLGGGIGPIRATDGGDLTGNLVTVPDGNLAEFSGYDISQNALNVSGTIAKLIAKGDVEYNYDVSVGAITTATIAGSFTGNNFEISARIGTFTISGNFQDSSLRTVGITSGYFGKLDVAGNISGTVGSTGSIGTILSRKGTISADIYATSDLASISASKSITSLIGVGGNVGTISAGDDIGLNPAAVDGHVPMHIDIGGNLANLKITSPKGLTADLYSTLNIGGNVGTITVSGMLAADLFVNGDVGTLSLNGDLGGQFDLGTGTPVMLGNVNVMGKLSKISLPGSANIEGDMTIGGDIGAITLNDKTANTNSGNIVGNITSLHGTIAGVTLTNGRIDGNIAGDRGITKVTLKGVSTDPASIVGDVSSNHGSVGTISVAMGNVAGSITGWALTGLTVTSGDLTGPLNIDGNAGKISVAGTVNSDIWVNGQLTSFSAGNMTSATLASLLGITTITVAGNVYNSSIIGGYNSDSNVADTDPLKAHSAVIGTMSVGGDWDSSLLAVGVMPGVGGDFRTSTDPVPGLSTLTKLTIKGAQLTNVATNLVEANTSYGTVQAGMPAILITSGEPTPSGTALAAGENDFPDGLIVKFNGPGAAWYDSTNHQIILNHTTNKTTVAITNQDASTPLTVAVIAGDDDRLSSLSAGAGVVLSDVALDGGVATVTAGDVEDGSTWMMPGGVAKLTTGGWVDVDMTLGSLGTYTVNGDITGPNGQVNVDKLTTMLVKGKMAVPLAVLTSSLGSLTVNGDLQGDVTARGPITSVTVNLGNFSSSVSGQENAIRSRDSIGTFAVKGGNAWGLVTANGTIKTINVTASPVKTGTGTVNLGVLSSRILARGGIGTVTADSMAGALVSTLGSIGSVTVKGDMRNSDLAAGLDTGDAGLGGDDSESNAFDARSGISTGDYQDVFGGGSIGLVKIGGNMVSSSIAAGVSPGLDGYFGTADDQSHGTGSITGVSVTQDISGSSFNSQSFAVTAANSSTRVLSRNKVVDNTTLTGNFVLDNLATVGGSPSVVGVDVFDNRLVIHFDHNIDAGTITPDTLQVQYLDNGGVWQTLPSAYFAAFQAPNMLSDWYDSSTATLTLELAVGAQNTWQSLPGVGQVFRVFLSGGEQPGSAAVADQRGNLLDGEFSYQWPSGDGQAGGDFYYGFVYGSSTVDLSDPANPGQNLPNILPYNQTITLRGINAFAGATSYTLQATAGDIIYTDGAEVRFVDPGSGDRIVNPSLSYFRAKNDPRPTGIGQSLVVAQTGPVTIIVNPNGSRTTTGPFQLSLMLFNDQNGNFDYINPSAGVTDLQDPPGQTPVTVTWSGDNAQIPSSAEMISAPDDADVYNLGQLPGGTTLSLSLDTYLIGSQMNAEMAVFNSNGDMVGNIISNSGSPDIVQLDTSLTLSKSVYLPADDTYYLAVSGTANSRPIESMASWNTGKYRLSVSKTDSAPGPVFGEQWVYLNFSGGTANFLKTELGKFTQATLPGLTAPTFDLSPMERQTVINNILTEIEAVYAAYPNIHFVTDPTQVHGQYSTVYFTDAIDPNMPGLEGIAETIDSNNQIHNDSCVVFGGAVVYDPAFVANGALGDATAVGHVLGLVGAHELGHILGLNHTIYGSDDIMSYDFMTDDKSFQDHTHLMTYAQSASNNPALNGIPNGELEFLIGYQSYSDPITGSLRSIL